MKFLLILISFILTGSLGFYTNDLLSNKSYLPINNKIIDKDINKILREAEEAVNNLQYKRALKLIDQILKFESKEIKLLHNDIAAQLEEIAFIYEKKALLNEAKEIYLIILSLYTDKTNQITLSRERILNRVGDIYYKQGFYKLAEEIYSENINLSKKLFGIDDHRYIDSLIKLALVYSSKGEYKKEEPIYTEIIKLSGNKFDKKNKHIGMVFNNIGLMYKNLGQYDKAENFYLEALKINKKRYGSNHSEVGTCLDNLGMLYLDQKLYERAEPLFIEALRINEENENKGPNHIDTAGSLNNLAFFYSSLAQFSKAENLYLRALEIEKNQLGSNHPYVAKTKNNLASLHLKKGLYEKAQNLFEDSLKIKSKYFGSNSIKLASVLNNLATSYNKSGLYKEAEKIYLEVLEIEEHSLGNGHPKLASTLNNLALNYVDQGSHRKAEKLYLKAIKITKKTFGPSHQDIAITSNNLANLYYKIGRTNQSEELFNKALEISKKNLSPNHPDISSKLVNLAIFYIHQNQKEKALNLLKDSLIIDLNLIHREVPFQSTSDRKTFINNLTTAYEIVFSLISEVEYGKDIALFARLNMNGLLQEIEQNQSKNSFLSPSKENYISRIKELTHKINSKNFSPKDKNSIIREKELIEREFYQDLPLNNPKIIDVSEVASALPQDSVLIEFQRHKNNIGKFQKDHNKFIYSALILKSNGEIIYLKLGDAKIIDKKIQQAILYSKKLPEFPSQLNEANKLWIELSDLIIQPLEGHIKNSHIIFLSPDSGMNRIPFGALNSFLDKINLTEKYKLRLLSSGRELLNLSKKSSINKNKSLVIANPSFNLYDSKIIKENINLKKFSQRLNYSKWSPLPGTEKEGEIIKDLISADLLTQEKATSSALEERKSPKIVHIASHSFYLPNEMKDKNLSIKSGIVLAGANNKTEKLLDDGYLTSDEISNLDWRGTELVVISSCDSGRGDIISGEGIQGIKRSIKIAGARSSLLSLWKVDDRYTVDFMKSFYKKLIKGDSRSDALAKTQKEFRNHKNLKYRHPFVWAAFQLNGDWRPINW